MDEDEEAVKVTIGGDEKTNSTTMELEARGNDNPGFQNGSALAQYDSNASASAQIHAESLPPPYSDSSHL